MPLTAQRVAEVYNPRARKVGSGWFVTPQLVLTVWHAAEGSTPEGEPAPGVPPPRRALSPAALAELSRDRGRCRVRALADAREERPFRDAVTVWWRPEADVALLLVTEGAHDPAPSAGWPATYWTDLTSADPVEVTAVGFPDHDRVGRVRESRQLGGVVHPLSGVRSGHWVVTTGAMVRSTPGEGWAGMSGAALFAGDRLVGVIATSAGGSSRSIAELRAVPARMFADDPLLLAWIRWAGGAGLWAYGPIRGAEGGAAPDGEPPGATPDGLRRRRPTADLLTSPPALLLGTAAAAGAALPWGAASAAAVATTGCAAVAARTWHLRRNSPLLPPELLAAAPADTVRDRGGLPYRVAEPGELARVYTRQHLDAAVDRDAETARPETLRVTGRPVSVESLLTDPSIRHIVVTGEAGVGKSSLLEYVEDTAWRWWRAATHAGGRDGAPFGPLLPLRIAARDLVGKDSVASAVGPEARTLLDAPAPVPGARVLVLVDALDEVTHPADWRQVMEVLLATARHGASGPGMERRLMLSARGLHDGTWRSLADAGATEFRLQPFTVEQLRRFVMAHQTGGAERLADPEAHRRATARAAEFLAYVRGNGMLDVVRLPLLAHLAVGQYFDIGDEPHARTRRVDLYARAVAEFLGRFPQRQGSYEPELRDRVEELLDRMRERYARAAPRHAAVTTALRGFLGDLADAYLRHGAPLVRAATALLTDPEDDDDPYRRRALVSLLGATGLVVDVHAARPRFLHRTFAEYLAAEHLRDRYGADPAAWGEALADAGTRIPALFAFDRQPAALRREIVDRLAADPQRVEQAAWLLAEGMCDDETRDRILDRLWRHPGEREPGVDPVIRNWYQTNASLAHLPQQRRRLHEMATASGSVPVDRVSAAAALAGHDPRGTDLLRGFAHDTSLALELRIAAAAHLAHVDPAAGTELLAGFADDVTSPHCARAAVWLAEHDAPVGTSRLRTLVADTRYPDLARVEAAVGLCTYDRAAGTDWLRRFAADGRFFADCRVYAADVLASLTDADDQAREATLLLDRIARDEGVDTGYRVEAAHRLAGYDADAGTLLLRGFADGALRGRYRCDAAVLLVQHDRAAGTRALDEIARAAGETVQQRLRAAAELAHWEPAEGRARLAALAREPGWEGGPRIQAAAVLARYDREAGLLLLRSYAAELSGDLRVTAARALADVDREEGMRLLGELAGSPEESRSLRVRAAGALGDFDPRLKEATLRKLGVDIAPGGWFTI